MTDARSTVLGVLLDHHPGLLSVDELVCEITADSEPFAARDGVEVALREVVEAGPAHRLGRFVFASHAAASFHEFGAA